MASCFSFFDAEHPRRSNRWRASVAVCACVMALTLTACSGSGRAGGFANENDELRRDRMELQEQVDQLETDLALRVAEIDKLKQQIGTQGTVEGADVPHVVALKFGRYTGGIDTSGDDVDDLIRIYLQTLDQHGRAIPVAGKATVQLVSIPEEGDPTVVTSRVFAPGELDAAYRQGLTGTHYTLEVALPDSTPNEALTVKVTLTDSASGATLTFQDAVPVRR
jgi:hypothetical protein